MRPDRRPQHRPRGGGGGWGARHAVPGRRSRTRGGGRALTRPARKRTATAAIELRGSLDRIDPDGHVGGWCWSPDEGARRREVAVLLDGAEAAAAMADLARDDLAGAGVGDGAHGFLLQIPAPERLAGATVTVTLRDVATGRLVGGERSVTWAAAAPPPTPAALAGNLDTVTRDGWLSGWCWHPDDPAARVTLDVFVDDDLAGTVTAQDNRPDLQPAGVGDGRYGFSFAIPYAVLADRGTVRISVAERGTGRPLGAAEMLQIGRQAAAEARVMELERQMTVLQGRLDAMAREAGRQPEAEERAARRLFATVAGFFQSLADGVADPWSALLPGGGQAGPTLAALRERLPTLSLRPAAAPIATVAVAADGPVDEVHACLLALHRSDTDLVADIVLLDSAGSGIACALLPGMVAHLRAAGGDGPVAALAGLMRDADTPLVAVVSACVRPLPGWLEALAETLEHEPSAALAGAAIVRPDGLMQHAGLALDPDRRFRDLGFLASAERPECRFMRPVDAVAALAFAADRRAVLAAGGLDTAFDALAPAVAELCLRLRDGGRAVLFQPASRAVWPAQEVIDPARTVADPRVPDEDGRRLRAAVATAARGVRDGFVGHALVVDDGVPRPDRDAGSVAAFEQMLVLRRLGWRVTFAAGGGLPASDQDRRRLERAGIEVTDGAARSVGDTLRAVGPALDLVHLYRHRIAGLFLPLVRKLAPRARVLFSPADLHYLREQREAALIGRSLGGPEATRAEELACAREADAVIVLSDHERDLLAAEIDPGKIHLLRWVARSVPGLPGFEARANLVFVGHFRHEPNVDAMLWYAREIAPRLRMLRPGLVLDAVGADATAAVRDLGCDDIRIRGWVPDLAPVLDGARMTIAPLRYGAGFKGKVASSLARGVPVVGTAIAFEGTGLRIGDGVALADEPDQFARAIAHLHDDAAGWAVLSDRARACVDALYAPEAATAIFRHVLADLGLPAR